MPDSSQGPALSLARARAFVMAKQGLSVAGPENVHDATLATAGVYGTAPT